MTPVASAIGARRWIGEPAWRANTYSSIYSIGVNCKSWQCVLPLFHIFRDWKGVWWMGVGSSRDSRMTIFFILTLHSNEQINISLDMSSRLSLYPYQNHRARRLAPVRACVTFLERFRVRISSPGHRNSGPPWEMLKYISVLRRGSVWIIIYGTFRYSKELQFPLPWGRAKLAMFVPHGTARNFKQTANLRSLHIYIDQYMYTSTFGHLSEDLNGRVRNPFFFTRTIPINQSQQERISWQPGAEL